MALLLWIGNYILWAIITLISGLIGGYGLAAGFDGYKKTKQWLRQREEGKKNQRYLSELEEQFIGSAAIQEG